MRRSYRYLHLDVFTRTPFGGNQLAVFLEGRGLDAAAMQAIAREMNFSESTFVLPPSDARAQMRVRIFTPGCELPMAGHPTVGTAFALAHAGVLGPDDEAVVFELGVGPTRVRLIWDDRTLAFAWMSQPLPTVRAVVLPRALLAGALCLPASALHPALPVHVVSCGVPYLLVPLASRADVDRVALDVLAYERLWPAGAGALAPVYVFAVEPGPDGATAYSRMFAVGLGLVEDAATGSAAGPLGCYLVQEGVVPAANAATIKALQGVRMGRPSVIHVNIASAGGVISGVQVGGDAVVMGEGSMYV